MTTSRLSFLAVLCALALCACPKPPPVEEDAGVDAGCDGLVGCACVNGACTTGECLGGTCTACTRGESACICRSNGTCNAGLRCTGGRCETCPAGTNGCPCTAASACDNGLVCSSGTCVPQTCVDGTNGCPCRADAPRCDGTQYCDSTMRCQTCSPDVAGCPCAGGACQGGLQCDTGTTTCRAAKTCSDLYDAGTCPTNQRCDQTPGSDAMCLSGMCVMGFKWNPSTMACVACSSPDCANEPDCAPDGGLATACAAQHRECTMMGQVSACGACLPGYAMDSAMNCVPTPRCGGTTCTLAQFCDVSTGTPTCVPLLCPPGQARDSSNTCTSCGALTCSGDGLSGRIWSRKTLSDVCVCETLDGWWVRPGGSSVAEPCDSDDDGWVIDDADAPSVTIDPALVANRRCTIRKIDRVRLTDEYGVFRDVMSCAAGLTVFEDGGTCAAIAPLRLLEPKRNDVPGEANASSRAPEYAGDAGRLLHASELNALTKGCVSLVADYNADLADDISQVQSKTPVSELERLRSFAYFMELYTSWYEPQGGTNGRLVIKERPRCSADFPLRYDPSVTNPASPTDLYSRDAGSTYWRSCGRANDPGYAPTLPGFDFAQYTCAQPPCGVVDPPHPTLSAPTDPATALMRGHGLCELGTSLPADGRWRGMLHHSQFKCVNVTSGTASGYGTAQKLQTLNRCWADTCDAGPCSTLPAGDAGLTQTRVPKLSCVAQPSATAGQVGFAAANFWPYGTQADAGYTEQQYQRGCVNEDTHFASYLCPRPEFRPFRDDTSFGRYSCFGQRPSFLWCGSPCVPQRSTLFWGGGADAGMWR